MFGIIYILAQPFAYRTRPSLQPFILLVLIMIAAATRGAALGFALKHFAASQTYPIFNRAISSLSNMTLQIVLTSIVFASVQTHNARKIRLISENDHLAMLTAAANGSISILDDKAAEPIRVELLSVVDALPSDNAQVTLEVLKATIDEVVRPLSHALDQEPQWQPPAILKSQIRFNWREALSEAAVPENLSPLWILYGLIAGLLPNLTYEIGLSSALFFVLHTCFFGFSLLFLVKLLGTAVIALTRVQSTKFKRGLFFAALIFCGLALGQYARVFISSEHSRIRFLLLAPVATLIVGTLVAILNSVFARVDAVERELKRSAESLTWTLAKTREIKRHAERTMANILHGKVQAAFAAAFLRIEIELQAGRDTDSAISEVKRNLVDFLEKLDFGYAIPEELSVTVSRIRTTWLGVTEISFDIDPQLERIINLDIFCLTTINDILPELCFNSINHGKAQEIKISIIREELRVIDVVVTDNGASELIDLRVGMGTRLLDECAMRWTRQRIKGQTVVQFSLPIGDDANEATLV